MKRARKKKARNNINNTLDHGTNTINGNAT